MKIENNGNPKMGGAIENVVNTAKQSNSGSTNKSRETPSLSGNPYNEMLNRNNVGKMPKVD